MDPTSRRSSVDSTPVASPIEASPVLGKDTKSGAAALATLRQDLVNTVTAVPPTPLKQQAIASGSRSDVKSSSLARSDLPAGAGPGVEALGAALNRPIDASRPVLAQLAQRGALYRQHAQARGEAHPTLSGWQEALAIAQAMPDLSRIVNRLFGTKPSLPPSPGNLLAQQALAQASLSLAPHAPLPDGKAVVDQLLQPQAGGNPVTGETAMQLRQRLNGIGYQLDAIADLSDAPLRRDAPGEALMRRVDALDKEIGRLLDEGTAPLPAPVRAHLARLADRVDAERGFALKAQAFARAYDTANMNFEEITAHLRHGVTTDQLRFILFNQSLSAAFRGSFNRGSPIPLPPEVRDSYDGLWQQLTQPLSPVREASSSAQDPAPSLASSQKPPAPDPVEDEPGYREYIPKGALPDKPQ